MKYGGSLGYTNHCCGVSHSGIQNPTDFCLKVKCSTGFIDTFLKILFLLKHDLGIYMKSTNNKNCTFSGIKSSQRLIRACFSKSNGKCSTFLNHAIFPI